jgi:hypothetical protein
MSVKAQKLSCHEGVRFLPELRLLIHPTEDSTWASGKK